jgi:hypothetical protein
LGWDGSGGLELGEVLVQRGPSDAEQFGDRAHRPVRLGEQRQRYAIFSGVNADGRPKRWPRAASRPSLVLATMVVRMNSASAAKTVSQSCSAMN